MEAEMFRVYVKIDGTAFDVDAFQNEIGSRLGGTIRFRKKMHNGYVERGDRFWSSRTIESEYPEDDLSKLLIEMEGQLVKLAKTPAVRIIAEIVEYISEDQSPRGFFLAAEIIQLLARTGANLDMDIVRQP
jgi:hypothetical protein